MLTGFKLFCEVEFGYHGPITPILGDGQWNRLSYGTSEQFGSSQPMLYVPVNTTKSSIGKLLSSLRRRLSKQRVLCHRDEKIFSKYACTPTQYKHDDHGKTVHVAKLMPTGESHITVANYPQLQKELWGPTSSREREIEYLKTVKINGQPLFDNGVGMMMPVSIKEPVEIIYGVSSFIDGNPIVALVVAECEGIEEIKRALKLSSPPGYKLHLTIGFAKAIWDLPSPDKKITDPANLQAHVRSGPGHEMKNKYNSSYVKGLPEGFNEIGRVFLD